MTKLNRRSHLVKPYTHYCSKRVSKRGILLVIVVFPDVSLDCHVEGRMLDNSIKRVNASPSLNKDKGK